MPETFELLVGPGDRRACAPIEMVHRMEQKISRFEALVLTF
jgi:hypothetical protein